MANEEHRGRGKDGPERLAVLINHPLRRRILRRVILSEPETPLSPKEMADLLERPLSNVSYHIRVLVKNNALRLADTRQVRGSIAHYYLPTEGAADSAFLRAILEETADEEP